ncbi:hypothetical protein LCGC14_2482010, partial [marine sediment metagenome]
MKSGTPTYDCDNCGTTHKRTFVPIDHDCYCALFFIIDNLHRASVEACNALEFGDTQKAQ